MESLVIQLLGREYKVAVKPEEKETLQAAVGLVTDRFQELAGKSASNTEALAVMTALNIAHEFVQFKQTPGLDLPEYRRRIQALSDKIAHATAKQETLF